MIRLRPHCLLLLGILLSAAFVQPVWPQTNARYTRKQIRQMIREARTQDQYKALADYFGKQADDFTALAAQEQEEVKRLAKANAGSTKYPSRVETEQKLQQFDLYQANVAGKYAELYSEKAKLPFSRRERLPSYTENEQQLIKRIDLLEKQLKTLQPPPPTDGPQQPAKSK